MLLLGRRKVKRPKIKRKRLTPFYTQILPYFRPKWPKSMPNFKPKPLKAIPLGAAHTYRAPYKWVPLGLLYYNRYSHLVSSCSAFSWCAVLTWGTLRIKHEIAWIFVLAVWLVLTYGLLEDRRIDDDVSILFLFFHLSHKTNRFHVAVRLFSNISQHTSKCGKNISDALG